MRVGLIAALRAQTDRWADGFEPSVQHARFWGPTVLVSAALTLAVIAALVGLAPLRPTIPHAALDLGLFSWMTIGPVVLGFFLWHHAVRKLGFVVASLFLNLTPVVAILVTAVALKVYPAPLQLLGGALVLVGVLQSQLRRLTLRGPTRASAE